MILSIIAIGFILYVCFLIGNKVGKQVPDETKPGKKYVSITTDGLLVIMTALVFTLNGFSALGISAAVVLILIRLKWKFTRLYGPITGCVLAYALTSSVATGAVISLLVLASNYLYALVEDSLPRLMARGLVQPVALLLFFYVI